jgi:hypothetical protein
MTVYVDDAFIQATVPNGPARHTSQWCHMTADSTEELIEFAVKLGLRQGYIQHIGTWKEHFDVTQGKRAQAVRLGAVEIDAYESVRRAHVRFELRELL